MEGYLVPLLAMGFLIIIPSLLVWYFVYKPKEDFRHLFHLYPNEINAQEYVSYFFRNLREREKFLKTCDNAVFEKLETTITFKKAKSLAQKFRFKVE